MKEVKKNVEQQRQANEDWYNRRYNENPTQRADALRLLEMTSENIRQRNREAAGRAAVGGGTEEAVAATKAANAKAMADAAGQIAANDAARKDAIEQQYQARENGLTNQLNQMEAARANAITAAAGGAATAAANLGVNIDQLKKEEE